jgi:hypothetical protein
MCLKAWTESLNYVTGNKIMWLVCTYTSITYPLCPDVKLGYAKDREEQSIRSSAVVVAMN